MNNEIKEMNLSEMLFNRDERLLDYITNLQQAIKDTKDTADDMLYELQQENERLKEITENLTTMVVRGDRKQIKNTSQYKLEDCKSRCEKAIEYINNFKKYFLDRQPFVDTRHIDLEYLLNILQNGSEEE